MPATSSGRERNGECDDSSRSTADARAAIASATDEHLLGPWTLLNGGKPVFTLPRIAVLRSFVISHTLPLAEAPQGFEMFRDKENECTKVVLKP